MRNPHDPIAGLTARIGRADGTVFGWLRRCPGKVCAGHFLIAACGREDRVGRVSMDRQHAGHQPLKV